MGRRVRGRLVFVARLDASMGRISGVCSPTLLNGSTTREDDGTGSFFSIASAFYFNISRPKAKALKATFRRGGGC